MNLLIRSIQTNPAAAKWLKREIAREKAERTLSEFINQAWNIIEPGKEYVDN